MIRLGFEPRTHSLEGCCSIQLSYQTDLLCRRKLRHEPDDRFQCAKLILFLVTTKFMSNFAAQKSLGIGNGVRIPDRAAAVILRCSAPHNATGRTAGKAAPEGR